MIAALISLFWFAFALSPIAEFRPQFGILEMGDRTPLGVVSDISAHRIAIIPNIPKNIAVCNSSVHKEVHITAPIRCKVICTERAERFCWLRDSHGVYVTGPNNGVAIFDACPASATLGHLTG